MRFVDAIVDGKPAGPLGSQLRDSYPSHQADKDFWRTQPHFPAGEWNPWVEALLDL